MSISKSLSWSYIDRWANRIISLLVFIILARLLEPKDFGTVAFARLFIDYLEGFSGQGLDTAVIQKNNLSNQHLNSAFWLITSLSVIFATTVILCAISLHSFTDEHVLLSVLCWLSISIIASGTSRIHVALLYKNNKFKSLAKRGLVSTVLGGVTGILFAINGYGIWSIVIQQIVSTVSGLIITWKLTDWKPRLEFRYESIRDLLPYSSRIFADQQLQYLYKRMDEALIVVILGATSLGYYSIAKKIYEISMELVYTVPNKVFMSIYSNIQNDRVKIFLKTRDFNSLFCVLVFPLFFITATISEEIIILIFGANWALASNALSILMISSIFLLTPNITHPIFNALGHPGITLRLNLIRAIISIPLTLIGANYSLTGIAVSVLFRNILGTIFDLSNIRNLNNQLANSIWKSQLKITIICVVVTSLVLLVKESYLKTLDSKSIIILLLPTQFLAYNYIIRFLIKSEYFNALNSIKNYRFKG